MYLLNNQLGMYNNFHYVTLDKKKKNTLFVLQKTFIINYDNHFIMNSYLYLDTDEHWTILSKK